MRFKRRRSIVFIAVFAALVIALFVLGYFQRGNLLAYLMSTRYSEEELVSLQEQSASDLLNKYGLDTIVPEPNDTTAPRDDTSVGAVTPKEETEDISPSPEVTEIPKASPDAAPPPTHEQVPSEALPKDVQNLVYSLYTLQSQYVGKLEGIRASSLAQYKALPKEERTTSKRVSLVKAGLSQALSLEKQCDGRVASILRELRSTLKKHGLDDSVADSAENYYATQKGLIKAEYMRKYNKYLK